MVWITERERRPRGGAASWAWVLVIACGRSSGGAALAASNAGTAGDAGADSSQAPIEYPPGYIVNLEPSADCLHPQVSPDCNDGFCRIPPGCFIMGAPRDEYGRALYSDVQAQVTLTRAFELSTYEVTNSQWLAQGFELPLRDDDIGDCRDPNCPISNVNLYESLVFLNRYSESQGLPACYELRDCSGTFGSGPICNQPGASPGLLNCERKEDDGLNCQGLYTTAASVYECEGYRLPTEAEWEYAARAGTRTAFWTGPIRIPPSPECEEEPNLSPIAWYCFNSANQQRAVGQKPANPWGLFDILGNVNEWTTDAFYGLGYGTGPLTDPAGYWWENFGKADRNLTPMATDEGEPERQDALVTRGGNFLLTALGSKASKRANFTNIYGGGSAVGFRMARTLPK